MKTSSNRAFFLYTPCCTVNFVLCCYCCWYSSLHIMKFKNNGWSILTRCIERGGRKQSTYWWVHTFSMEILTSSVSEPVLPANWIQYQCALFGTQLKAVWDLFVKRANWLKRDDALMLDVNLSSHKVKVPAELRDWARRCAALKVKYRMMWPLECVLYESVIISYAKESFKMLKLQLSVQAPWLTMRHALIPLIETPKKSAYTFFCNITNVF